jgi:hypothetical protein
LAVSGKRKKSYLTEGLETGAKAEAVAKKAVMQKAVFIVIYYSADEGL